MANKTLLKSFSLVICFLVYCGDAYGQEPATGSYNLEQSVAYALKHNRTISASAHILQGSVEGSRSALGSFGPSASGQYGHRWLDHEKPTKDNPQSSDRSFFAGVNVHQDLFTGFALLSTYQKAVLTREKNQAELAGVRLQVVLAVQESFLKYLEAEDNLETAGDSVARLKEQLKVTKAFFEVGLKPRFDVLQAEVDLANALNLELAAINNVAIQKARLNTLLNLDVDSDIKYYGALTYQPFKLSLQEALQRALAGRPDLFIAKKSVKIAMKDKNIVASSFYPSIGADFDWSSFGDSPSVSGDKYESKEFSEWSASVTASWKFFEWGKTYFANRQSGQVVSALMSEADSLRKEASFEVKSNLLNVASAAESIKVNRKAVEAAKEGYRMATARYQAKVGTNEDVLSAQERLTSAQANLTASMANYQIALARTFISMGEMNPGLKVK